VSTKHLSALFNPDSIVVIGASERSHSLGGIVLRNIISSDSPRELMVINTNEYKQVHGIPCFKKVSKLPIVPDLAIVCTPPDSVPRLIKQLGYLGVKTVMILTGGLSRTHSRTGRPLMYSVQDAARKTGIRVLGPNTIGVMAPHNKLNATYAHMGVLPGKIAFIGQSGTIASAVIDWAFSRGVGFSHFLTLGDGIDIAVDDLIDYLAQDRHTKAILLHIEHIPRPERFISAVRTASRAKLVIAVKSGRVPESQWEPEVLPSGIANSDVIYDAVFRRAGVLRVNGTDEMFDALETLNRMKSIRKEPLTIIGNGLGPMVLAVDKLFALKGTLAKLSEATLSNLTPLLPSYWTRKNPIDLNYDASPELYGQVLDLLSKDKNTHNVLVMYAPSLIEDTQKIAQSVVEHSKKSRLNIQTCWLGQSTVRSARDLFYDAGIPTYFTPEKAVKAFMYQVNHKRNQNLLKETPLYYLEKTKDISFVKTCLTKILHQKRNHLTSQEARKVISAYGIQTTEIFYCDDIEEVVEQYSKLNCPVNVTLLHQTSCHPFSEEKMGEGRRYKTTLKRLNDETAIKDSCKLLFEEYKQHYSDSGFLGYSIQKSDQHIGGLGFSLGITRDPVFGPLVVCGAAGASVNIISDRRVALPPLNLVLAKNLLQQSYMFQKLKEFSYQPEKDIQAVCETLITLSKIVIDNPVIRGLEIHPLLFNKNGVVAADVSIDLAEPAKFSIQPYPVELCEEVILPLSGRKVELRPIRGEDEPAHVVFHSKLSNESIRFRFFHYRKSFTHDELAQMVQIDYNREMVFIASAPVQNEAHSSTGKIKHETLGSVRTWTDADNLQTEFAIIISDSMRGEGLGRLLMEKMIHYCKSRGTVEMIGSVLPNNRPMLHLAEKLGFDSHYDTNEEVIALKLPLNSAKNEWQKNRLKRLAKSY